ncbi:MAG: Cof-type HAD-IIB family hydrolase [Muribaculaceae bacterium]|nr:Cof-type HAD-IIB family hydrolase [Muribaculaceae bacterium]
MKTLYVSDMDGTLLGPDSLVSPRTAEIITGLSRKGALITVATARTPATVVPLLADTFTLPPAIVMTGAATWDRARAVYDNVRYISENERHYVADVCHQAGLHPFVYVMDGDRHLAVYHDGDSLSRMEQEFYDARASLTLKHFCLKQRVPDDSRTVLWYAMGDHEPIFAAAEALRRRCDLSMSCYYDIFDRSMAHLEIFAPGVSKAAAVLAMKERVGADRVVVFGDNLNDIPMMEIADCAVAVGNAFDEVKAAADIVIAPNTADSVAHFILTDFHHP